MRLYLAGGVSGNLYSYYIETMKIFIAQGCSKRYVLENYWNFFIKNTKIKIDKKNMKDLFVLESFFYCKEYIEKHIPLFKDFLLDSGAFTFFSSKNTKNICWEEYVDRYADFISRNNIEKFFELDIDKIVGYEKVLELRKRLESKTNRQCIPVWHRSRERDEYFRMCDEYSYIAIGGIVSKEISQNEYPIFSYLIDEAHKRSTLVHGLGFTNLEGLKKYHFDSVDSTSWTSGNRFGAIDVFNGSTIVRTRKGLNSKLRDPREVAFHNFYEWVKFQKYAELYL